MSDLYIIADGGAIQDLHTIRRANAWPSHDLAALPTLLSNITNKKLSLERSLLVSVNLGTLEPFHNRMESSWTILPLPIYTVAYQRGNTEAMLRDKQIVLRMHAYVSYLLGQLAGTEGSTAAIIVVGNDPHYVPALAHARQYADVRMAWWRDDAADTHIEHFLAEAAVPFVYLDAELPRVGFAGLTSAANRFLG